VAINASLALQVAAKVTFGDHAAGFALAREILASGLAWQKLEELVKFLS
jgi:anthranilate phosphoribosyltransferase